MNSRKASNLIYGDINDPIRAADNYFRRQEVRAEIKASLAHDFYKECRSDKGLVLAALSNATLNIEDLDLKTIAEFYSQNDHLSLGMYLSKLMDKQMQMTAE